VTPLPERVVPITRHRGGKDTEGANVAARE
jgi:hypothetical protein